LNSTARLPSLASICALFGSANYVLHGEKMYRIVLAKTGSNNVSGKILFNSVVLRVQFFVARALTFTQTFSPPKRSSILIASKQLNIFETKFSVRGTCEVIDIFWGIFIKSQSFKITVMFLQSYKM
jgi:hypothetical protein